MQARSGSAVFADWAETTLVMEPAIYLRGLPAPLNLKTQPVGGWPVTVTVGTAEDLGQLTASIALTRTNDSTPVHDLQVDFAADISGAGEQRTTLHVGLPERLRPGRYEGQISFTVDKPAAAKQVRLPAPIAVSLNLARPAAQILSTAADFGSVTFETSPNFRINQTALVRAQFTEAPFNLVPALESNSCPGLELVAGNPQVQGDVYQIPLSLRSSGPIHPQTCSGTFTLHGPSEDYEVQPATPLSWRLVIPKVEWELVGVERNGIKSNDIAFGSLGRSGERGEATLLVRYTGQPPFTVELLDLQGQADRGDTTIGREHVGLEMAVVTPDPDLPNVYRVPLGLVVRKSLPHATPVANWLAGTDYIGRLQLDIVGLPASAVQEVNFRLHNPSWYQRYIQPFYRWWWPGVLTCPLSLLIPLILFTFVWLRKKDADVERLMRESQQRARPAEEQPGPVPPAAPGRQPGVLSSLSARGAEAGRPPALPGRRHQVLRQPATPTLSRSL
jgi:hypothetical protein